MMAPYTCINNHNNTRTQPLKKDSIVLPDLESFSDETIHHDNFSVHKGEKMEHGKDPGPQTPQRPFHLPSVRSADGLLLYGAISPGEGSVRSSPGGSSKFMGSPKGVRTLLPMRTHRKGNSMGLLKPPPAAPCLHSLSRSRAASITAERSSSDASLTSRSTAQSFTSSTFSYSLSPVSSWGSSSASTTITTSTCFRNHNMIAQRSGSKEVKAILTQLAGTEATEDEAVVRAVEHQCSLLANLVVDAYYKVVMAKFGGARILSTILRRFLTQATIQEAGLCILEHLAHSSSNGSEQVLIGVILNSMQCHPSSIHVQSAACQALWAILNSLNTTAAAANHGDSSSSPTSSSQWLLLAKELVDKASEMYLTPAGRECVSSLQQALLLL